MAEKIILCTVIAQAALAFYLMFLMGHVRIGAIKRKEVKAVDVSMRKADLPDLAARVSNCYHNQFEMPVLFYALVALVLVTKQADYIMAGIACAYVAVRYIHSIIHISSTNYTVRFYFFTLSALVLMGAYGLFGYRVLMA